MRYCLIAATAVLVALPGAAQELGVSPGLYDFNSTLRVNGAVVIQDSYEYCLDEETSKMTVEEAIADLTEGAICDVSNVSVGSGHASADMTCQHPEDGFSSSGTVRIVFDDTSYDANARATISGAPAQLASQVAARRRGDCPAGWTPPAGISAD